MATVKTIRDHAAREAVKIFTSNYGSVYPTDYGVAVRISSTDHDELERFAVTVGVGSVRGPYIDRSCPAFPCECVFGFRRDGTACEPRPDWFSYGAYNLDAVIQVAQRLWNWLPENQRFRFEDVIDDCLRERLKRYRGRQTARAIRVRAGSRKWRWPRDQFAA